MSDYSDFFGRLILVYRKRGLVGFILAGFRFAYFHLITVPWMTFLCYVYKLFRRPRIRHFVFRGKQYEYFYHPYNFTWASERIVEVPIGVAAVQRASGQRILEVGNVLGHYIHRSHDVLDKYERAPGVTNCDVIGFRGRAPYDLIVSISTLEHVGWDVPEEKDPQKVVGAVKRLASLLAPGGTLLVTVPLGYNNDLDRLIDQRKLPFTRQFFLKRTSEANEWREAVYDEVRGAVYNSPFFAANAILIGLIEKQQ